MFNMVGCLGKRRDAQQIMDFARKFIWIVLIALVSSAYMACPTDWFEFINVFGEIP